LYKLKKYFAVFPGLIVLQLKAQIPSESSSEIKLTPAIEYSMLGVNFGWTAANYIAEQHSPVIPKHYFTTLIPVFDDFHKTSLNKTVARISDASLIFTAASAGFMLLKQNGNSKFKKAIVLGESLWLTYNLTQTVKQLAQRTRPYTLAPGFNPVKRDDFYSFFSGHSSFVACLATSAWLMRANDSKSLSAASQKIMPWVITILAVSTAGLRVYAGKHYPSDVLSGLCVGTAIAYINYKIHEK
jgi:membrane-associated phospholipid phosphatase